MIPLGFSRVAALVAVSLLASGCALGVAEPDDGFDDNAWRGSRIEQRNQPVAERAGQTRGGAMSPGSAFQARSDPNKPTPDPWVGMTDPTKPTPDPWVDSDDGVQGTGSANPADRGGN